MSDPDLSNPDCSKCPSFLKTHEAVGVFNRATGSPMCATFGNVLGKPGATPAQEKKLREHTAKNCPGYMKPKSAAPLARNTEVMLPDPTLRDPGNIDPTKLNACTSCSMCANFIGESVVASELGWSTGLCAAKGKLLFTNKLSQEARNCEYRQVSSGATRGSTAGLMFLPIFSESFLGGAVNPVNAYREMQAAGGFIEPGEYPSDREVSEEEITAGIKAWRKFPDPDGSGREVFFPVYEASFFDDDLRALIPRTGSDEHPELYIDHFGGMYALGVAWLELDETPLFSGQAGVGKTELLRHAAWIMQVPFRRISITADSEVDDIIGKMEYDPEKGTYFRYGRLPAAWSQPGVLCLDEPNVAKDPAVWHAIRPLTDNSKQMVIDQNKGEIIDRNDDCYLGLCINPAWDTRNVGALEIADADVSRLFHVYIDMPPAELEREIIQHRVRLDGWELDREQMNSVMATAKNLRDLSDDQEIPITWALRPQIKVARALRWFSPIVAYRRAIADFLEPEVQEVILDQVRANWTEL